MIQRSLPYILISLRKALRFSSQACILLCFFLANARFWTSSADAEAMHNWWSTLFFLILLSAFLSQV